MTFALPYQGDLPSQGLVFKGVPKEVPPVAGGAQEFTAENLTLSPSMFMVDGGGLAGQPLLYPGKGEEASDGFYSFETKPTDPKECVRLAINTLRFYNKYADQMCRLDNSSFSCNNVTAFDSKPFSAPYVWYKEMARTILQVIGYVRQSGGEDPLSQMTGIYWTFYEDAQDAPFGDQCQLSAIVRDLDGSDTTGYTGYVSIPDNDSSGEFAGAEQLCLWPFKTDFCAETPRFIDGTGVRKADTCFGINEIGPGSDGEKCRKFFSVEEGYTETMQDSKKSLLCSLFPSLDACMCLARNRTNSVYNREYEALKKGFGDIAFAQDSCWFEPCKVEGVDRIRLSTMVPPKLICPVEICANLVKISESEQIDVDISEQFASCSDADFDKIRQNQDSLNKAGGGGYGSDGEGQSVGKTSIYVIVAIVLLLAAIVLLLAAAVSVFLWKKNQGKKKKK